jgi:hypothetical protein
LGLETGAVCLPTKYPTPTAARTKTTI